MTDKNSFLSSLPLFSGLDLFELDDLAAITREYDYPERAVVAYQRDVADRLIIVREGHLLAYSLDDRGELAWERHYMAGDYFDDRWLFTPHTFPATVKTVEPSRLMIIGGSDFLDFVERHPGALDRLDPGDAELAAAATAATAWVSSDEPAEGRAAGLSAEAWEEALQSRAAVTPRQFRAARLQPDELIMYEARRSPWLLLLRTIWPVALLLVLVGLIVFTLLPAVNVSLGVDVALGAVAVLTLGVVAFRVLDWRNDYFIITNRHLIHHEFSLRTFRSHVDKIPIDQVQSVEIDKPTLLANLLGVGTARVTTASQLGTLYFDFIDEPDRVAQTLNELRARVRSLDAGRVQAVMRASLESHFNVPPPFTAVGEESDEDVEDLEIRLGLFESLRARFGARVEQNGSITYRKHIFRLFYRVRYPAGIGLVLNVLFALVALPVVRVIVGVILLFVLGWFVWQLEDWRNDTFQVNDEFVVDIDRRPFGFGESRKQAQLDKIQNISAVRPNLLATLFNYGDVRIETAGATADITFESVVNPNSVQSEIFERRERFRQRQQAREGERRRKEYAVLLDVYQQAMEQGRIPNRTRPEDA